MCGIAGFWINEQGLSSIGNFDETLRRVTAPLSHRGPDGFGFWSDYLVGLGLGHRRLAILDCSSAGSQPMVSSCERYVLVFNGEIYNHLELRATLDVSWRGHSDTETLLASFVE